MVDALINTVVILLSAFLSVPTAIYATECAAAAVLRCRPARRADERPAVAIVVPAHNEESEISLTLSSIRAQLLEGDRLIVVADNCDDGTAMLARQAGAQVIERQDWTRRGKGYALEAGISVLAAAPPPVVILIDADCRVEADAIGILAREALACGRPVQARYLLKASSAASIGQVVAAFAFLVKNRIRPLGLHKLGLPCQLTGSGMAFPWAVIGNARLANAHLVEDMKLGLDLARAGQAPCFCDDARITSRFPVSAKGAQTQRQRWETGHLGMGRLALAALLEIATYRNPAYLAMVLDVIVPPLSLLALLLACAALLAFGLAVTGLSITPLIITGLNLALLLGATACAWSVFGRKTLPPRELFAIPVYILGKIGLYPRLMLGRVQSGWIRTDRDRGDGQ